MSNVIIGHLRPDQQADAIVDMIDTYADVDDQSWHDQLSAGIMDSLDVLIANVGFKEAIVYELPMALVRRYGSDDEDIQKALEMLKLHKDK